MGKKAKYPSSKMLNLFVVFNKNNKNHKVEICACAISFFPI